MSNFSVRSPVQLFKKNFPEKNRKSNIIRSDIQKQLQQWGILRNSLVITALNVGGIMKNPIYRVYMKMGTEKSFEKMFHLIEDKYFSQIVKNLKNKF
jgi:hypothetical protein